MNDRGRVPVWLCAFLIGAAVGLFDALAFFLHPAPAVCLLFSPPLYGLAALGVYSAARAIPRAPSGLALGLVCGLFVLFFGGYFVTTSTAPTLQTAAGLLLGLATAVCLAGAAAALGWRLERRLTAKRGGPHSSTRRAAALMITAALLLAYPALAARHLLRDGRHDPKAGPPPRGFVLISLDAARGDRISALGYPRPTTLSIDALVERGAAFSRAYVQSPCSAPGHACMLTGLPPLAHGVLANTGVLDGAVLTIAERLRAAGFHTAAFLDNYYLDARFGFDQGFEVFINQHRAARLRGWHPRHLLRGTALYHACHRLARRPGQPTDDTLAGAIAWLRHRPPGDFFLFLHIMDPHSPYEAPADLRDIFYVPDGDPVHDTEALRRRLDRLTEREVAALRDLYDAGVALADRKVGRLTDELRRLGLFDTTLIVVTADHGEVLYEKDRTFDHGLIWQGSLHVPLVISYPEAVAAGQVCDAPVPATALVPTAFALLDVPYAKQAPPNAAPPAGPGGAGAAAVFHTPLLRDGRPVAPPDSALVFTLTGVREVDLAAAIGPRFKLVAHQDSLAGFYDLAEDPTEQRDLRPLLASGGAPPGWLSEAERMQAELASWLEMSARRAVAAARRALADADLETRRHLRALGYVD